MKFFCSTCKEEISDCKCRPTIIYPTNSTANITYVLGGIKHDSEKSRPELIPAIALEEEAKVWAFGAKKYEDFNWAKGLKLMRILGAILRHTMAIMAGVDRDLDSGHLHAAHIRCNAAMLIYFFYQNRPELDDRLKLNLQNEKNKDNI